MKTKTISIDISTISKSEDIISLMDETAPTKKNEKISLFFQGADYNRPANKNLKTTLETFKELSSKYNIDAIQMLELNIYDETIRLIAEAFPKLTSINFLDCTMDEVTQYVYLNKLPLNGLTIKYCELSPDAEFGNDKFGKSPVKELTITNNYLNGYNTNSNFLDNFPNLLKLKCLKGNDLNYSDVETWFKKNPTIVEFDWVNIIKIAFCERESHNNFFNKLLNFLEKITKLDITNDELFIEYIKLELALLSETGHQLQLDSCVAEGDANNLYYVSPKSGHAVSYKKGKPYENKLLILPEFLKRKVTITTKQKKEAIALTSYFLTRYIFHKKYEPYSRRIFIKYILQQEATVK